MSFRHFAATVEGTVVLVTTFSAMRQDLKDGRIPNRLLFICLGTVFFLKLAGGGLKMFLMSVTGMLVPLCLLMPLFLIHVQGAGDIKLLAVIGAYFGPAGALKCLVLSYLAGGVCALVLMVRRRNFTRRFRYLGRFIAEGKWGSGTGGYLEGCSKDAKFCFSVPVFISLLIMLTAGIING